MELRHLKDLKLAGKKVFLRLDLNVPIKNGKITDETRILEALPTVEYILQHTNKLAIASHLGRPEPGTEKKYTLEPVGVRLAELLKKEVLLVADYTQEPVEHVMNQLSPNQVVLLENLRFHEGETKNDINFARHLMSGFDFYVDDAFGCVHRAHASVVACAELVRPESRASGFLIEKEIKFLDRIRTHPQAPYTVVMGGAKVSDKMAVMLSLLDKCNHLIIGGAMAYTFLKFQGKAVGQSKIEADKMDLVSTIYKNAEQRRVQIHLPVDHVCAATFDEKATPTVVDAQDIPAGLMGLDIGPKTAAQYAAIIEKSKTVFWNGPMGVFEFDTFAKGTLAIANAMAKCGGLTVIGGGDSVAAANKAGVAKDIDHISTGGGASIEYLEGKILPGIRVLLKN